MKLLVQNIIWLQELRDYEKTIRNQSIKDLCNSVDISKLRYNLRNLLDFIEGQDVVELKMKTPKKILSSKKILLEATPFLKHKNSCSCVTCMWLPSFISNFNNANCEIVICAAVKTTTGKVIRGHRHGDCFITIKREGMKPSSSASSQGFITSRNRYVTREVGRKLQDAAGIKSVDPEGYRGTTLFSEDLY